MLVMLSVCLQWRRRVPWVFQVLGLVMYVVASADIAYTVWLLFGKELKGDLLDPYMGVKYLLYVTNKWVSRRFCGLTMLIVTSMFADSLLLYRCFIVWNHSKRILIGPTFFLIGASVCGYVFAALFSSSLADKSPIYISLALALNIYLTTLIGNCKFY